LKDNCTVQVRISDNVLEEDDWSINELVIQDGVVVSQKNIYNSVHALPDMLGWTTNEVEEWTHYDPTGAHPENYYELEVSDD
jgi:hypothetical protein